MEGIQATISDVTPSQTDYFNLGTFHRSISTPSSVAQIWFNRGLIWTYSFNHEEATLCFDRAINDDKSCAMAYWGLAYALGPNYNKPWDVFDERELEETLRRVSDAVVTAEQYLATATSVEQALIKAIQLRYPQDTSEKKWTVWNQAFANAMRSVYEQFPDDLDVTAIYADSLMNLTPWKLWNIHTGQVAEGAHTIEIKSILDRALQTNEARHHPGLLHLYIHLMEMSPTPESALTIADNLRGLVPDAGHLNHMPSHLDVLCGDYRRAMSSNEDSIRADDRFFSRASSTRFYTLYRCHDFHFRIYAAMLCGQSKGAMETVSQLESAITEDLLRVESPPMADWIEGFLAMRVHALVRFGKWEDILALPLPEDETLYCTTVAMIHYGRAIALAITKSGQVLKEADEERKLFTAAVARVPRSRTLFNNTCVDILQIASLMLDGEIEYRRQNYAAAFTHLQNAISLDDTLPYDEPWGWMQPTRHAYGALLLEQNLVEEAAAVYCADLGLDSTLSRALQHPNNVWSLHGYYECLTRLGREAEARILEPQLRIALAIADVAVEASCFCRLSVIT